MLSLKDVNDFFFVDLFFSVKTQRRQYSPILESLVEFYLHEMSLLAFSDPLDIVPPSIKHSP